MAKTNTAKHLIPKILEGIEEIKGEEIKILDLREIENMVCEYFIICQGTSNTQVNALANAIEKHVSKTLKEKPWHTEGLENSEWVLIDYSNVVIHIFQKHIREYYNIEELWGDAKHIPLNSYKIKNK